MTNNGVNRNLQYWFGISVLILVIISAFSYSTITNLLESRKLVDRSNLIILKLEKATSLMKDAERGQRGFLLTKDEDFLQPYEGAYQKAMGLVNQVQQLAVDNLYEEHYILVVKNSLKTEQITLGELIKKKRQGKVILIDDLGTGKAAMSQLKSAINKMEKDETDLLHTRLNDLNEYADLSPLMILISSALSLAVSLVFFKRIEGDIKEKEDMQYLLQLKEQETASINEELSAANEELTGINEEYAATNEQLSDSRQKLQALNEELEIRVKKRTWELEESEKKLQNIMDTIPQIAWTSIPGGEANFYNRRWFEYTGLNYEQTNASGWKTVVHPDDLEYNLDQYRTIAENGVGGEFEIRERNKEGMYRWHLVRVRPIKDENGTVLLWVGTATDIQEIKQLQQQKDDFISIASHELKTPVTTLKASLQVMEMMKNNPKPDKFADMIGRANKSMNRVTSLIDDLLNVSKFSQGQFILNKNVITLSKTVNDCSNHMRAIGPYNIHVTGDMKLQVNADSERIEQVLTNLINNAIKYAPKSEEIKVHIERIDHYAKISVIDQGPGIAPEKVPNLFDRYFRAENSGYRSSGLGIGLYICSEIIKKHQGEIGVDTELGKGSTFWFTLPV
ncbi:ATP-binding protein [Mucilaginibacter sp. McL0603]|uniref:ATP-binding protein n=1 Tax=Mucilaginibacter sp. McL0603 TaxID=3415670 RepID=UPI003CF7A8BD